MANPSYSKGCGITRRGFLLGTAAGLGVGAPLSWLGLRTLQNIRAREPSFTGRTTEVPKPELAMPGRLPGRVVEVRHPAAVSCNHVIDQNAVNAMVDRGMTELTGADHPVEAWRSFFAPDDVIGIKVNPVGRKPAAREDGRVANAVGAISSPEVLLKVVAGLKSAQVPVRNIIVFERYAEEFCQAGYDRVMNERAMDGVRWLASAVRYTDTQVDIRGFDPGRSDCSPELARHVVGYDPDVFAHMGFAGRQHDRNDDRRYRSHLSMIVSRMVNKIITLPVLKDHRSAGVTLALKNMSHGFNNNVARSHLSEIVHRGQKTGPNQCNTFIPTAVSQQCIREKATLHILDGLIGVYEGGPGCWNQTWGTWRHQGLFFATDPVALDHVGWDIIDAKRAVEGWPAVARMGSLNRTSAVAVATSLAALAAQTPAEAATLSAAAHNLEAGAQTEIFDQRQPQHIILAGALGLGVFDRGGIEYRVLSTKE